MDGKEEMPLNINARFILLLKRSRLGGKMGYLAPLYGQTMGPPDSLFLLPAKTKPQKGPPVTDM
jgi:hypothetical protein